MEEEEIDLLDYINSLPNDVKEILDKYSLEDFTYEVCENLQNELETIGYTIDYGLDAEPYNLRKK